MQIVYSYTVFSFSDVISHITTKATILELGLLYVPLGQSQPDQFKSDCYGPDAIYREEVSEILEY